MMSRLPLTTRSKLPFRSGILSSAILLAVSQVPDASAQVLDYGAYETLFEEPITASVTGSPQRASDVPATMEIITADRIRRSGARDIPGVLRHVTGLNVTRWTNNGADVSIRGYNSVFNSRLLVMINGRQVYADHYGYVPWSTLPVSLKEIHQIEIVKGPNSALFGFNAVGGVINIITANPLYDDIDFVQMQAGTQDLVEGAAAVTLNPSANSGIRLSLQGRRNDDFSTQVMTPLGEATRFGDERKSARIDVHFRPRDKIQVELEASWARADQTNVAPTYSLAFEETVVHSLKGVLSADTAYGLIEATAYRNQIDNDVYAPSSLDGVNFFISETPLVVFDNEVTYFRLQDILKPAPSHTLRFSGEYRESALGTTPVTGAEISYDVLSAAGMWQWQAAESLTLTGALRVDRLDLKREGIIPEDFFLTNADWDRRLTETSFNFGLVWHLNEFHSMRLAAARGVQLPSLYNLGGSLFRFELPPEFGPPAVGYFTGIPTLSPTTVDNIELAWEWHLQDLGANLRLALFHGKSREVIADTGYTNLEAGIFTAPANIGDSKTGGIEVSLQGNADENWRWLLGYVYQEIDDDFGAQYPTELTLRNFEDSTPVHSLNASLGWSSGPWEIDGHMRYVSETQNMRAASDFLNPQVLFPVDDFGVLDVRAAYRFSDSITVELAGQNLGKGEQVQHTGPAVERKVHLGMTMEF